MVFMQVLHSFKYVQAQTRLAWPQFTIFKEIQLIRSMLETEI